MSDASNHEHESSLLSRAVNGDKVALERLLLDNYSALEEHLARLKRGHPGVFQGQRGAEDFLQETFARAYKKLGEFEYRGSASFIAWLKTIAANLILDARRRASYRGKAPPPCTAGESSVIDWIDLAPDPNDSPSQAAAKEEAAVVLRRVLETLPGDYQLAVRLRFLQEKSLAEIAQILGRSVDAVRGILDRARKKLREQMGGSSLYSSK